MKCEKCGRWFDRPLELYNGEWACPNCHEFLALNSLQLRITDETEDLFKLSEICYLRALKAQKNKKEYDALLNKAINYCKDAAHAGHPKALLRLGFLYDSGYFSMDSTEAFKLAYEYYRAVWSGKINDMRGDNATADYADGGLTVKKSAARLYLQLLKNAPEKMRTHPRYRYETELVTIRNEGLYDGSEAAEGGYSETERSSRVIDVLQSCFSKERAPLFGLLHLTDEEFSALCQIKDTGKERKSKLLKIAEKVSLRLISVKDGSARAIKNAGDLGSVDAGDYYLYFFNTNGKHRFSGGKMNAVKKALEKGDAVNDFVKLNELISAICEGSDYSDYVFSDDDVLVYKSKTESVAHALGDLIKAVNDNIRRGEN